MRKLAIVTIATLLFGGMVSAGDLNGHVSAWNGWTSSTAFDNEQGLSGYVDWAVFGPGDFPYSGYSPTAGELTYAYQVFCTGTDAISSFSVAVNNPADNVGSFSGLAGDAVLAAELTVPGSAQWTFAGIDTGGNSEGLAYSSLKVPEDFFGVVVNGGSYAVAIPLPTTSAVDIPEPATIGLLAVGGALLLLLRRRRARRVTL